MFRRLPKGIIVLLEARYAKFKGFLHDIFQRKEFEKKGEIITVSLRRYSTENQMEHKQEKMVLISKVVFNKFDHPRLLNQSLSYFKLKSINFQ